MKTIIIDDEPLAIKLLEAYVNKHPELSLSASFTNPIDGLEHLRNNPADLLLLDIQMPELNGLHVARLVRGQCKVIFTTAYEEHALKGFDLDAIDYLLKPISYDRFCRAVVKATSGEAAVKQSPAATAAPAPTSLFVKSGTRTLRLQLDELTHGSSSGDYLTLYLADGNKILTLENLTDFLTRLPADRFCRIHRSHFVALPAITFVERRRVVIGETWLPVSDGYREAFTKLIG
ncbi:LytR/AlgR family response regulator transcription factor [Neolewinella persica]|uniref:LytR/AlgR family response regulator transcription factor n=1 Tax=Neolewinella persica TaxID=70998 RepID=UPI00035FD2E3|nr:LytTR family DNA-binding domain-containing protein [Neolewinella persica]